MQPKKAQDGSQGEEKEDHKESPEEMENMKIELVAQAMMRNKGCKTGPPSGITKAVPRFKEDLEAILEPAMGDKPAMRCVQNNRMLTAYYGFGDISSAGFWIYR